MIKLIDSHSHLNDDLLINDISNIYNRMKENNVYYSLVPSWDIPSSISSISLSNNHDFIYSAIGLHPENINESSLEDLEKLEDLSKNDKVIAIGEIGLDYHYLPFDKELQKKILIKQFDIANKLNLPVIIHMRDATEDFINLIKEYMKDRKIDKMNGVMHSFSGSIETMNILLSLGFYISFSGPVTFKNAKKEKECAILCPIDRLLIETDSPYLTPEPFRGKINESKNVYYIAKYISELKNITIDELSDKIIENFNCLFKVNLK